MNNDIGNDPLQGGLLWKVLIWAYVYQFWYDYLKISFKVFKLQLRLSPLPSQSFISYILTSFISRGCLTLFQCWPHRLGSSQTCSINYQLCLCLSSFCHTTIVICKVHKHKWGSRLLKNFFQCIYQSFIHLSLKSLLASQSTFFNWEDTIHSFHNPL